MVEEKYVKDSRQIIIEFNQVIDEAFKSRIREAILGLYDEFDLTQKFDVVKYILTEDMHSGPNESSNSMWVKKPGILHSANSIYINGILCKNSSVSVLKKILAHELTHLWYFKISAMSKTLQNVDTNLYMALNMYLPEQEDVLLKMIRLELFQFYGNILSEGFAEYKSKLNYENCGLDNATFKKLYKNATESIIPIKRYMNRLTNLPSSTPVRYLFKRIFIDKSLIEDRHGDLQEYITRTHEDLRRFIKIANYAIGHHAVHAILFVDKNIKFEEIMAMSHLQFIKKYEACMNIIGKQPAVSINSGKGMLDYKMMIEQLNIAHTAMVKKIQK